MSWGSSVGIVSECRLDEQRSVCCRGREDFSSSLSVQTGSDAHPASCLMGTEGPFPGPKARPGSDADHSSPSSAEVKNEEELYYSPLCACIAVAGQRCFYFSFLLYPYLLSL
jgi:hypothetical protein